LSYEICCFGAGRDEKGDISKKNKYGCSLMNVNGECGKEEASGASGGWQHINSREMRTWVL
jgi:hypothetical protein